jgi:hypothetical protein
VRRPGAKEGGREEEEKRSGIAARHAGRLRSNENRTFAWTRATVRSSRFDVATTCVVGGEELKGELMSSKEYHAVFVHVKVYRNFCLTLFADDSAILIEVCPVQS